MACANRSKHTCMRSSVLGSVFCMRYRSAWLVIESIIVPNVIALIVVGVEVLWDAYEIINNLCIQGFYLLQNINAMITYLGEALKNSQMELAVN